MPATIPIDQEPIVSTSRIACPQCGFTDEQVVALIAAAVMLARYRLQRRGGITPHA